MAQGDIYITAIGMLQQFKKDGQLQPAVTKVHVNNQDIVKFTIRTGSQQLLSCSVFPELQMLDQPAGQQLADRLQGGQGVIAEGKYTVSEDGKYKNLSVYRLCVIPAVPRTERETVNPVVSSASAGGGESPLTF